MLLGLCALNVFSNGATIAEDESFLEHPHYHGTNEIQDLFARLAKNYPDLARVHSIGTSLEGRDLTVIEISKNVRKRSILVPMFKYVANMHGDETVGREMLVYLAEYLLRNYGRIPEVTQLVDKTDIFLMPSMNPDGFERSVVSRRFYCKMTQIYKHVQPHSMIFSFLYTVYTLARYDGRKRVMTSLSACVFMRGCE